MGYLRNNNLGAVDAYTFSASFWFFIPDGVQDRLLDSLAITTDVYNVEYDNLPFMIYCLSSSSSKLTCEVNQPIEWAQHPVHHFDVNVYNMLSTSASIINDVRANGQFWDLTLPPFPADVGITGYTLSQIAPLIMRADDGNGHVLDIDFSTSVYSFPQSWPPPNGGPSAIPATAIDSYSNVFKNVHVVYEGDYVDAASVARRHFFNTTTNCIVRNGWNHCAMSIDNSTLPPTTHLWIINGVNRTGLVVNFDSVPDPFDANAPYVTSPWVIQFNGAQAFVPSDREFAGYGGLNGDNQSVVRLFDYQVWTNQFINWTNAGNFSEVVTIRNGIGYPATLTNANNAFGRPTIRMSGDNINFPINTGTGGTFTKGGTITDFTPTPSY